MEETELVPVVWGKGPEPIRAPRPASRNGCTQPKDLSGSVHRVDELFPMAAGGGRGSFGWITQREDCHRF